MAFVVVSASGPVNAGPVSKTEKRVLFVGFSEDESKAAWHITIERHVQSGSSRYVDRYALVRLVEPRTNTVLGNYRYGVIERFDARGRPMRAKSATLVADNPPWAEAAPASDWTALERRYHLEAARLSARSAVAVRPDPDVDLSARPAELGLVEISGDTSYLGYTLALASGSKAILGRFRHEAKVGQRVTSKLEVMTSVKGNFVAVVNRFEITNTDPDQPSTLTYGKIVRVTSTGGRAPEEYVWVRTAWGWKKMTVEQERKWRNDHVQRVAIADLLHRMANGGY